MVVPASTFSWPAVRFWLVTRVVPSVRRPYCTPSEVVAENALLPGVYVCTALALRFRFRLLLLDKSDVPGSPSLGSNCSSGGKNRAFCWVKKSAPPRVTRRR